MRHYQCHEKCYDGSFHRPGDDLTVPESTFKPIKGAKDEDGKPGKSVLSDEAIFIEKHFTLISNDKEPAKPADPEAAVKAFVKKHNISDERQEDIFKQAKAVEPHEKMAALAAVIRE